METGVQMQVTDASTLANKTVFLKVSFGTIGNVRKVKQDVLRDEVSGQTEARTYDKELVKASKTLLESPELEEILKHDRIIKRQLQEKCLSCSVMEGALILPHSMVDEVFGLLVDYKENKRPELVKAFRKAYPELKDKARQQLGPLFTESDYPSFEQVEACFAFNFHLVSFGAPGQLKAISPAAYQKAAEKAEAMMVEAATEAKTVLRQALLDMVSKLKDSLATGEDGKPKRLHKAAVTNIQDFLKTFDLRNVTDDKELAELTGKLRGIISGTNAEALRSSDTFREAVAGELSAVSGQLAELVELKPNRVFKSID